MNLFRGSLYISSDVRGGLGGPAARVSWHVVVNLTIVPSSLVYNSHKCNHLRSDLNLNEIDGRLDDEVGGKHLSDFRQRRGNSTSALQKTTAKYETVLVD